MNIAAQPIQTLRTIFMTIGAILFIFIGVHTAVSAGSPQAARTTQDIQPEIHSRPIVIR